MADMFPCHGRPFSSWPTRSAIHPFPVPVPSNISCPGMPPASFQGLSCPQWPLRWTTSVISGATVFPVVPQLDHRRHFSGYFVPGGPYVGPPATLAKESEEGRRCPRRGYRRTDVASERRAGRWRASVRGPEARVSERPRPADASSPGDVVPRRGSPPAFVQQPLLQ